MKKTIKERINVQRHKIYDSQHNIDKIAREAMPEYNGVWHRIGDMWDCETSPLNMCVYNEVIDPAWDDCIFCHEPYERK